MPNSLKYEHLTEGPNEYFGNYQGQRGVNYEMMTPLIRKEDLPSHNKEKESPASQLFGTKGAHNVGQAQAQQMQGQPRM